MESVPGELDTTVMNTAAPLSSVTNPDTFPPSFPALCTATNASCTAEEALLKEAWLDAKTPGVCRIIREATTRATIAGFNQRGRVVGARYGRSDALSFSHTINNYPAWR